MTPADVRVARQRLGLTQEQLAATMGVTWSTVARWESTDGEIPDSRAAHLRLLVQSREAPDCSDDADGGGR